VYGSNSVMEMVRPGQDKMSFFSWLTESFATTRYGGSETAQPPLGVAKTERVSDAAVRRGAAADLRCH
jgi:hypothetical protein